MNKLNKSDIERINKAIYLIVRDSREDWTNRDIERFNSTFPSLCCAKLYEIRRMVDIIPYVEAGRTSSNSLMWDYVVVFRRKDQQEALTNLAEQDKIREQERNRVISEINEHFKEAE